MKILVVSDLEMNTPTERCQFIRLIESLITPQNELGLIGLQNSGLQSVNITHYENIASIRERDWNIVLIQGTSNMSKVSKSIRCKPLIFISLGDTKHDQCYNLSNLYYVITLGGVSGPKLWGIPVEWIKSIQVRSLNFAYKKVKPIKRSDSYYKLVHFVHDVDIELKVVRDLIRATNHIAYASLLIITTAENIALLKDVANSNISFALQKGSWLGHLKHADLVLASKEIALISLLSRRPTIIVGSTGLGGLVCADNVVDFIRTGFEGRIGGTMNEELPINLLDYEIKYALGIEDNADLDELNDVQYQMLEEYYENDWQREFFNLISSTFKLSNHIGSSHLSLNLTPRVSDNIQLHTMVNGDLSLINAVSGKLVGTVGHEESKIITDCKGTLTIGDIVTKYTDYDSSDIRSFIVQLWMNKVLTLQNPGME